MNLKKLRERRKTYAIAALYGTLGIVLCVNTPAIGLDVLCGVLTLLICETR
jgi:hypothetical protein